MKIAVATDINSGISQVEADRLGVFIKQSPVIIDGAAHFEGVDLLHDAFFQALSDCETVSTSQPSLGDVSSFWNQILKTHDQIVYIPISNGLSTASSNASALAESEYKNKVFVVDNHRVSVTQKSSVLDAVALVESGFAACEIKKQLEATANDSIIYIGVDSLEYLLKSGRITPTAAAMGTALKIKPLLMIKGERLDAFAKVRSTDACKKKLLEAAATAICDYAEKWDIDVGISHSYPNENDAIKWEKECRKRFQGATCFADPLTFSVASHVGPNSFAIGISRRLARSELETL